METPGDDNDDGNGAPPGGESGGTPAHPPHPSLFLLLTLVPGLCTLWYGSHDDSHGATGSDVPKKKKRETRIHAESEPFRPSLTLHPRRNKPASTARICVSARPLATGEQLVASAMHTSRHVARGDRERWQSARSSDPTQILLYFCSPRAFPERRPPSPPGAFARPADTRVPESRALSNPAAPAFPVARADSLAGQTTESSPSSISNIILRASNIYPLEPPDRPLAPPQRGPSCPAVHCDTRADWTALGLGKAPVGPPGPPRTSTRSPALRALPALASRATRAPHTALGTWYTPLSSPVPPPFIPQTPSLSRGIA